MRERTKAEIEAVLTAYHGADGWDEQDRVDMSYALAAADEAAPPAPVVQKDQPIPDSEIVRELKQLHLSLMSSEDARYRGDAFARAAICIEALEADRLKSKLLLCQAALRIEALEVEYDAEIEGNAQLYKRIEALEAQKEVVSQSRIEAALRIWYPGANEETMEQLKYNGTYELMEKVLAVGIEK